MLLIRAEQLRALNQRVHQNRRNRLVWHFGTRAADFGLDPQFMAAHVEQGLSECARFQITGERDVELFLSTVFRHYGGFLPGPVAYPPGALRFLTATGTAAPERVRRFAEWSEQKMGRGAPANSQ